MTNSFSARAFHRLAKLHAYGGARRHLSFLLAGWLSLIGLSPGEPQAPLTGHQVVAGAVVLLLFLLLLGPVLNALGGVFYMLGHLSGVQFSTLTFGLLNAWRYIAGRRSLLAFVATKEGL